MNDGEGATAVVSGLKVATFLPDAPSDAVVYLISPARDASEVWRLLSTPKPALVSIEAPDWNRDLSPWEAPKVFKGGEAFAGGANAFLHTIVNGVAPTVEVDLPAKPRLRCIAGVSLGGLFAVYSLYQTPCFDAAASVSGSFWFPGFVDYLKANAPVADVRRAYFSVGDLESRTKNAVLATVEAQTLQAVDAFKQRGVETIFELNKGNHFVDGGPRLKRAIEWLCQPR